MQREVKTWLLITAILSAILAFAFIVGSGSRQQEPQTAVDRQYWNSLSSRQGYDYGPMAWFSGFVAIASALAYLGTRKSVLRVSSSGGHIVVETIGAADIQAREFVTAVEEACIRQRHPIEVAAGAAG